MTYKKNGGIRFLKIGRASITLSFKKAEKREITLGERVALQFSAAFAVGAWAYAALVYFS